MWRNTLASPGEAAPFGRGKGWNQDNRKRSPVAALRTPRRHARPPPAHLTHAAPILHTPAHTWRRYVLAQTPLVYQPVNQLFCVTATYVVSARAPVCTANTCSCRPGAFARVHTHTAAGS